MRSFVDHLRRVSLQSRDATALIWREQEHSYGSLLERMRRTGELLDRERVGAGTVVTLPVTLAPAAVATLLSLLERRAIVVLLGADDDAAARHTGAQVAIELDSETSPATRPLDGSGEHALYDRLRRDGRAGLVLFTSGSTGSRKAAVHDFEALTAKLRERRKDLRTLGFFPADHIGGLDTLLYCLANASSLVVAEDRSPDAVCALIDRFRVEVLPVSPSFLNLLLLSGAWQRHDLASLRYITYGAEVMPAGTLSRCAELFPQAQLLQRYGATEFGSLRSRSRTSDSLWLRMGGHGLETRVVDGELQLRSGSTMLGYLEGPSPFTDDGWFRTGDAVDVDGDYLRVLGRRSEIINVGGEIVHPAEVEEVLRELSNVAEARVSGEENAVLGSVVAADVRLLQEEERSAFARRLKAHCRDRLAPHKIPMRVHIKNHALHGERFTKIRSSAH